MDQTPAERIKKLLYFDYFSSTPVLKPVADFLCARLQEPSLQANASSPHAWGQKAQERLERAREHLCASLGLPTNPVVFTSCATESIHLAILGSIEAYPRPEHHLLTWAMEHPATLGAFQKARRVYQAKTHILSPKDARIDLDAFEDALKKHPISLVSVSWVQHELGYVHDWPSIVKLAHAYGALVHLDASQAIGKCVPQWETLPDYITLPSHKCFGPQGIAALYLAGRRVAPLFQGGDQQYGYRSGTEPVMLAEAMALTYQIIESNLVPWRAHTDRLWSAFQGARIAYGLTEMADASVPRVHHTAFVWVPPEYETLWRSEIMCAQGSACNHKKANFSKTLTLMGVSPELMAHSYRLSWCHLTTVMDFQSMLDHLGRAYQRF